MEKLFLKDWLFKREEEKEAWKKDFDDSDWKEVQVPHDWSVEFPFEKNFSSGTAYLAGGIGWYRARVPLSSLGDLSKKVIKLHFEGVYKNARVWVNGYHFGHRPSGYSSFIYDLTEIIKYNQNDEIVISVRVERNDLADSRWYNGNGINKNVSLEIHDTIYIDDYGTAFSTPHVDELTASIKINHHIINSSNKDNKVQIIQTLKSLQTDKVFKTEQTSLLAAGEQKTVTINKVIENPELWSPEQANLYKLTTSLKYLDADNQEVTNEYVDYVGIRYFNFDANEGFKLNGIPMKIKGVCLHEDAGSFGTAVPVSVWTRRLLKLKEMGTNAIRMAHNPHSTELYRLCDILGFLVFDEAFDEWDNPKNKWWNGHNVYPPKLEGAAEYFPNWFKKDLENMILRNRNHPSIIAWSIGNEVDYPNDPYANPLFDKMTGNNDKSKPAAEREYNPNRPDMKRLTTIANELIQITKEMDPTRPVTLAAAFPELSSQLGLIDNLDVVGYNYKEHLYEEDHQRFPNKPFIGSENSHGYREWSIANDLTYISGQFLWTGIDYLGEAHGWPVHGSPAGLLTLAGFEKAEYYKRKSWWSEKPTLHLTTLPFKENSEHPEWKTTYRKWEYLPKQQVEIRCYTNSLSVKLTLANQEISNFEFNEKYGYYSAIVPYKPEALKAEATFGSEVLTDELHPTYGPAFINAKIVDLPTEWINKIDATDIQVEKNMYQIECHLLDINEEPTLAEKPVHIEVVNGTLLGIENGDLSDVTEYSASYRRTYQGKLICFVKANENDELIIKFKSGGIAELELPIKGV